MAYYKHVLVCEELTWLDHSIDLSTIDITKERYYVTINYNVGRIVGTAKNFTVEPEGIFCDLDIFDRMTNANREKLNPQSMIAISPTEKNAVLKGISLNPIREHENCRTLRDYDVLDYHL